MIIGIGVDLCEVDRIKSAIGRHGVRFTQRVFTPGEIAYAESKHNRFERYAARFAAKEAAMKAIGTGWRRGVRWQDFEVRNLPGGRPTLLLHGQAARIAAAAGIGNIAISLTHTSVQASAFVIAESA